MIQEDFEQHVVKLQNALLGFAKSLTHNEDEAKDLLQETSLKALSNKAMYDDSTSADLPSSSDNRRRVLIQRC